jgi:hypothetical protein
MTNYKPPRRRVTPLSEYYTSEKLQAAEAASYATVVNEDKIEVTDQLSADEGTEPPRG